MGGSSGAPIFNEAGQVIGIHHRGARDQGADAYNQGTLVAAFLSDIQSYLSEEEGQASSVTGPEGYVRIPRPKSLTQIFSVEIINDENEILGEIVDLIEEDGDDIYIVSVGEFLGLGIKNVAVEGANVTFFRNKTGSQLVAVADYSPADLENRPEYKN